MERLAYSVSTESGAYGGYWTNIAIGDEVCVTRDPTTGAVTYSINGTVVYTSSNTSTATMYVPTPMPSALLPRLA